MKKRILITTFLLNISIVLLCILLLNNCSDKKSVEQNYESKHQRLEMLGNLLEIHLSITSPGFQPGLPHPIIILKDFEPIPPDDPEYAKKVIAFLPAVNYWRRGRSNEVIKTINNLNIQDDIANRFLMDAYVKLDLSDKAIEFGDKIKDKDNQIIVALGICALRARQFDRAIDYFTQLKADTTYGKFVTEQIGNAYFMKAHSSQSDSAKSLKNSYITEAIAHWKKVQNSAGLFPRVQYALGVAYYLLESYEKARDYFYEIYEKRENDLLARLFILLSLHRQRDNKELDKFLNKIYIESKNQTEDARNLLKTVIFSYYFLGEDQYENGNYDKAREYWLKARKALYAHDFPGEEKLDFLYIRAIISQMIKEIGENHVIDEKDLLKTPASLFTFQELYDSLSTQSQWNAQFNQFADKIGDILFMLNEKELSYKFFKLVQDPGIITFNNIVAINPKENHSISVEDLMVFSQGPYSFFVVLNLFSSILTNQAKYDDAPQILEKLIVLRDSVKADDRKVCNALLLQFCDSLRVGANRHYDKLIRELEAEKSALYIEGKNVTHIEHELEKVYEKRQKLSKKILQVQSKIPEMFEENLRISNYLFIPADSLNTTIDHIFIFPLMNFSLESCKEKRE